MKLQETNHRATTHIADVYRFAARLVIILLPILAAPRQPASAQQLDSVPFANPPPLTAEQVVYDLTQMNLHRVQALRAYQGTRTYRIDYQGFPGARSAEMVVKLMYRSPRKKEFVIQSATGSKLIIDKVLKNLLEAEEEELAPEIQRRSALTEDNYHFKLIGRERGFPGAGPTSSKWSPGERINFCIGVRSGWMQATSR